MSDFHVHFWKELLGKQNRMFYSNIPLYCMQRRSYKLLINKYFKSTNNSTFMVADQFFQMKITYWDLW